MPGLISTKLHAPLARPSAVDRARLLDRLGRGAPARLTLVSAPPGFGKTTLVAQWLAGLGDTVRTAWVSLEAADDEPAVFWRYVAAAVSGATGGDDAVTALLEGGTTAHRPVTGALLAALEGLDRDLVLVLDDYHVIESGEIGEGMAFLVEHLPPRAHLVLLTRADPPLPLPRLRVRGELAEVRAADLRFTIDESAAYLNGRMGLGLDGADVGTLEARTEGWIAALQLAAISMQGRADPASFIAAFAGDDRLVVDYLADEVLERQPEATRRFLLDTAVLERLSGPLCDAVTGGTGGSAMLEALDRANLFLVPLDDRRRWYRYHHLFADLLRARLHDQRPDDIPGLHRRASAWWETQGQPAEAIGHALAAGDAERAADLIEVAARGLRRTRQEATLCRWLDALPDHLFEVRPVLAIAHAGALLSTGQQRGVEERLLAAERWVAAAAGGEARAAAEAAGMIVRHAEALGHLPSAIALYRAALAQVRGDLPVMVAQAGLALAGAGEDQPLERGAAAGLLALAHWSSGDLDAAHATWSAAVRDLDRAGHHADVLGGTLAMADILAAQGRLGDARRTLEQGLRQGMAAVPPLRGTADMHVALAEIHGAWNDEAAATAHLEAATTLGEALGLPQHPYRLRLALAGRRAAQGDPDGALALVDEAELVYVPDFFPEVRPVPAVRARLWTRLGRHREALGWAAERGLTVDDEPAYLREYEHVTLAQALVARARATASREDARAVGRFADRLLAAAEAGGRWRAVIELRLVSALAADVAGDRAASAAALGRALELAGPEGQVGVFLEGGPAVASLLADAARPGVATAADPRRVLAAFGSGQGAPHPPAGGLVEPLSERELEVLRLLAGELDGPEIADRLFVSVNTLRTHTRNIFGKLGVSSRRAAVARATELGLLARRP